MPQSNQNFNELMRAMMGFRAPPQGAAADPAHTASYDFEDDEELFEGKQLYAARWPNESYSLIYASSRESANVRLDEVGDPGQAILYPLKDLFLDFSVEEKPLVDKTDGSSIIEKTLLSAMETIKTWYPWSNRTEWLGDQVLDHVLIQIEKAASDSSSSPQVSTFKMDRTLFRMLTQQKSVAPQTKLRVRVGSSCNTSVEQLLSLLYGGDVSCFTDRLKSSSSPSEQNSGGAQSSKRRKINSSTHLEIVHEFSALYELCEALFPKFKTLALLTFMAVIESLCSQFRFKYQVVGFALPPNTRVEQRVEPEAWKHATSFLDALQQTPKLGRVREWLLLCLQKSWKDQKLDTEFPNDASLFTNVDENSRYELNENCCSVCPELSIGVDYSYPSLKEVVYPLRKEEWDANGKDEQLQSILRDNAEFSRKVEAKLRSGNDGHSIIMRSLGYA